MAEFDRVTLIPGTLIYTSAAPESLRADPVAWYFTGWSTQAGITIPDGMPLSDRAVLRDLCLEVAAALEVKPGG